MASGDAALRDHLARIRELAKLARNLAPAAGEALAEEIAAAAARQESPSGSDWRPAKDGRAMLRNVKREIETVVVGTTVFVILTGRYARHHLGAVRGGRQKTPRRILPTRLSKVTERALVRTATGEFRRVMGEAAT